MRTFKEAVKNRRSIYGINGKSPVSDDAIKEILDFAMLNTPSAFNSQSVRMVLLLNGHHKKLWDIVKNTLKGMMPAAAFPKTEERINSFASGHGTVLYFQDTAVVESLQRQFPLYKDNFPIWAVHSDGMHQFVVWTMLEDAGFGASLQHYNPIIDDEVKKTWNIDANWRLTAQMPFGIPTAPPDAKTFEPLEKRIKVFK